MTRITRKPGYGRPLAKTDERIPHILRKAKQLGLDDGPYVALALEIERTLLDRRWRFRMNVGAIAAALCADLGFSHREYYLYMIPSFVAGMLPCYIEALEKPEGTFLPLRCSRIAYEGKPRRPWTEGA